MWVDDDGIATEKRDMIETNMKAIAGGTVFVALISVLGGCQEPADLALPTATQAKDYYTYDGALSAEVVGNVVTVSVAFGAFRYDGSPSFPCRTLNRHPERGEIFPWSPTHCWRPELLASRHASG